MGIFSKVNNTGSSTDWRTTKKIWVKVSTTLWRSATALYGKTLNGWVKMWPGNAPSVRASDPINIRLGGYNGTIADSVELFCSTNAGTSGTFLKLWGNDGSFDGVTPITITNRRMLCSDNIDGQVERFSLTGNDTIDFATTTQANRDLAEGYYIFYQLLATNVDGALDAYSPPVKVIKRRPALLNYTVLSESGGTLQGNSGRSNFHVIELNAQIRWGWWIRPGGYLGGTPVLKWWRNTTGTPGGTLLKEINIETGYNYVSGSTDSSYTSNTNTSNVLTIYSNYGVGASPLQTGEYIVAELYLENSYTAHYAAPVSFYGVTGGTPVVAPPTFLTATTNRSDGVNLSFGGSADAASYDIFWNTSQSSTPSDSANPDFPGESSPFLDTTIGSGVTRWYWVRARNSGGLTSVWYPAANGVVGTRITPVTYNVNFVGNGGSSGNEGIPWSFVEGGSVTVPSATRIGFTFDRWTDTPFGSYTYTTTNVGGLWFPPPQNITMYARWIANVCTIPDVIGMMEYDAGVTVNNAGFLYEFTDYLDTTNISLNGRVAAIDPPVGSQPGCGTNITLTIYTYVQPNLTPPSISSVAMGNPGGPVTVYFNGGSGPYYQMWWTTGSAGTSYDASGSSSPITDSTGPGSAGTWYAYVRSVSSPTNTGTGPSTTISAWSPAFAFTVSNPVTCGSCQDYGSATYTGQTTGCVGTYYTVYNNYSIGQRQTCSDGSYQYCANRTYSTVSSSTQIDGQCGYTTPVACVCEYTDLGSYHYSPQCCPGGSQRTGSLSGFTVNACCPNVSKTLRYVCKNFDVVNSSSVNYYDCFSVGQCAAQQNPDGSRETCYI